MDFLAEYCSVVEIDELMADKVLRRDELVLTTAQRGRMA
jgi:hypothetical protein